MAEYVLNVIERDEGNPNRRPFQNTTAAPVESSYMLDRI